jgi:hypothetical protein
MSPQKSYSMGCFPVLPPVTSQGAQTSTARGVGESRENKTGKIQKKHLTNKTKCVIIKVQKRKTKGDNNHEKVHC